MNCTLFFLLFTVLLLSDLDIFQNEKKNIIFVKALSLNLKMASSVKVLSNNNGDVPDFCERESVPIVLKASKGFKKVKDSVSNQSLLTTMNQSSVKNLTIYIYDMLYNLLLLYVLLYLLSYLKWFEEIYLVIYDYVYRAFYDYVDLRNYSQTNIQNINDLKNTNPELGIYIIKQV